ncbi:hypothetical protein MMC34_000198 [Xylographa carneopallida]|nr:hypothetical protein [Xylographa carneopallida]
MYKAEIPRAELFSESPEWTGMRQPEEEPNLWYEGDQAVRLELPDSVSFGNFAELSAGPGPLSAHDKASDESRGFAASLCQDGAPSHIVNEELTAGTQSWHFTNKPIINCPPKIASKAEIIGNPESIGSAQIEIAELYSESAMGMPLVASNGTTEGSPGAHQTGRGSKGSIGRNLCDAGQHLWRIHTNELSLDTVMTGILLPESLTSQPHLAELSGPGASSHNLQLAGEAGLHRGNLSEVKDPSFTIRDLSLTRSRLNAALPSPPPHSFSSARNLVLNSDTSSTQQINSITSESRSIWRPSSSNMFSAFDRARSITASNTVRELVEESTSNQEISTMDIYQDLRTQDGDYYPITDSPSIYSSPHFYQSQSDQFPLMVRGTPSAAISPSSAGLSGTSGNSGWSADIGDMQETPISITSPTCGSFRSPVIPGIPERILQ